MMRRYVFYDKQTGALHPEVRILDLPLLAQNTPDGFVALSDESAEPVTHSFDIATKKLIERAPLAPDADHEWDPARRRFRMTTAAARRAAKLAEIRRLEQDVQPRAIREGLLQGSGFARLREIDERITQLRQELGDLKASDQK